MDEKLPALKNTYNRGTSDLAIFNINTGRLLRMARRQAGFSQQKAANDLGYKQYKVSRIEKGSALLAHDLIKFSRLYKKPISFFYNHDTLNEEL